MPADTAHIFNDLYLDDADITSGKLKPPFLESKKVLVEDGKLEDWTGPVTKIFSPILKKSQPAGDTCRVHSPAVSQPCNSHPPHSLTLCVLLRV